MTGTTARETPQALRPPGGLAPKGIPLPEASWPPVPPLEPLRYIRYGLRRMDHDPLPAGLGPGRTLGRCTSAQHPYSAPPPLDPLLARARAVAADHGPTLDAVRLRHLATWTRIAAECEGEREAWLQSLPRHAEAVYRDSGFHGPLFGRIHRYLVTFGYPDKTVYEDVCAGFPSGGVLPRTGLWPERADAPELRKQRASTRQAFAKAPARVSEWLGTRKRDAHAAELEARNENEVKRHRREEVSIHELEPGTYVAHPEFMATNGAARRACDDCTASGWNPATVSEEKLTLCSVDDPVDYASRLLRDDPAAAPELAVGDEDTAYRNWANGRPDAMIMLLPLGKGRARAWRDFALCFGDVAAVYGYNRVRLLLTYFFRVEFCMAVWSYFDDSALVEKRIHAQFAWNVFLRIHDLLSVPIKGNPLSRDAALRDAGKYFPPATANRFLGEWIMVGSLPCAAAPTNARRVSGDALIAGHLASGKMTPAEAASAFGKLRFLASALHGKCGLPALQPLAAREHERRTDLTPALRSALIWLRQLLAAVGPREWPWDAAALEAVHIFGDASEPSHSGFWLRSADHRRYPAGAWRGGASGIRGRCARRLHCRAATPAEAHLLLRARLAGGRRLHLEGRLARRVPAGVRRQRGRPVSFYVWLFQ